MQQRFKCIARVEKTHGRKGEVVTVPAHGLPSLMRKGMKVAVVPPALKGSRWHEVLRVEGDDRAGSLVALSGVDDIAAAQELVGKYILAFADDLPDDLALHDPRALIGREICHVTGKALGTITEVMCGPANDVWVIEGQLGEVLLPVIDQVVIDVPEQGAITVDATGFVGKVDL